MPETSSRISDLELVRQAVEMPGQMGPQYTYFRELSLGNQAYLYMQGAREIVGKYIDWPKVGRHVIAKSRAYEIIRPWFRKIAAEVDGEEAEAELLGGFVPSRCMFILSQTEGEPLPPIQIPKWDMVLAMDKLGLREVEFDSMNGNLQGYSRGLEFAISPIARDRRKTMFHEWAHIVGGHTMPSEHANYLTHRGLTEAEAEIAAMLCMKEFGLLDDETAAYMRGYAQHWLGGTEFPETSARKVLKIAGAILNAGRVALEEA
jgi:hypothetical protein